MSPADSFHISSTYPVLVSQSPPPTLFSCHSYNNIPYSHVFHLPCSHVVNLPCSRVLGTSVHLPCSRVVRLSLCRITVTSCTYPVLVSSAYPYLVSKSRQMHLPCSRHSVVRLSLSRVTVTSMHLPCSRVICLSLSRLTVAYPVLMSSAYPYLVSQSRPAPTLFSCPHRVQPTPKVKVGELLSSAVHHLVPLGRHPQPQAVEVAAAGSHAHHQRGGHTDI